MGSGNILNVIIHFGSSKPTEHLISSLVSIEQHILVLINDNTLFNDFNYSGLHVEHLEKNYGILGALRNSRKIRSLMNKYHGFLVLNNDIILIQGQYEKVLAGYTSSQAELIYFPVMEDDAVTRGGRWNKYLLWPFESNNSLESDTLDYYYGAVFLFSREALRLFVQNGDDVFRKHFLYFEELLLKRWSESSGVSYLLKGDLCFEHIKSLSTLKENSDSSFQAMHFFEGRQLYLDYIQTPVVRRFFANIILLTYFAYRLNTQWLKALLKSLK